MAKIEIKGIGELLGNIKKNKKALQFIIPSYQRGYRWDKQQVKDLLKDIWEFSSRDDRKRGEFYCLQPIIVKKDEQGRYVLIDGQQRLTTIFIILKYFKDKLQKRSLESFTLEYETRKDSKEFLDNIIEKTKEESNINIDYLFMYQAYQESDEYLCEIDDDKIYSALTFINRENTENDIANNVRIIWYELDNNDKEQELFVRINTNKIPLTNAELIKALFLHAKNFKNTDSHERQIEMAKEFDEMSYALEEESFYYFLSSKERITKIELLFEILAFVKNKKLDLNDKYALYRYLAECKEKGNFLNLWSNQVSNTQENPKELEEKDKKDTNIKKIFLTFKSWQKDRELYHLIGFLVATSNNKQDETLKSLYKKSLHFTKSEFKKELYERIKEELGLSDIQDNTSLRDELQELKYNNDDNRLKNTLLFFNIATILNDEQNNHYFDFKRYKNSTWSLEHIYPQTNDNITQESLKEWLKDFIEYSKELEIFEANDERFLKTLKLLEELKNKGIYNEKDRTRLSKDDEDKINELIKETQDYKELFIEKFDSEKLHAIGNLTLLSKEDNSAFSNHAFMIKREILKEKEHSFIPLCSKNVFMKHYSKNLSNFWENDDAENYFKAIINAISKALNLKEEEHAK
ncbi:DUF262 domain-containing protein [Helicobacter cetorum]|uniref:DUF262 domain-containing protein n=1 Tax=Helicobacter cetorum (strain ATCC BAA-429 / MIT 00-7128) TaxID=182217 RepID=I0EPT8_HELC0|nr:DUF262 domain-containing protein [Helicobacter cetorum]AFI04957.1 hypothetical protein HCW_08510 [Helicobacter cetorum MIT 00-7128]